MGHPRRAEPPPGHLTPLPLGCSHGQGISIVSAAPTPHPGSPDRSPRRSSAGPFQGLTGETDWVALREILPAATAVVTVRPEHVPDGAPSEVTVATVLPLAWPGLHRADGTVLIGTQSGNASGDASRDLAGQLLAALDAEPGHPVVTTPQVTADSPRLQDVLTDDTSFEVTVHEGFDFWVGGQDLEGDAAESLERANATVVPTARLIGAAVGLLGPHRRAGPHPPRPARRRGRRHRRPGPPARGR